MSSSLRKYALICVNLFEHLCKSGANKNGSLRMDILRKIFILGWFGRKIIIFYLHTLFFVSKKIIMDERIFSYYFLFTPMSVLPSIIVSSPPPVLPALMFTGIFISSDFCPKSPSTLNHQISSIWTWKSPNHQALIGKFPIIILFKIPKSTDFKTQNNQNLQQILAKSTGYRKASPSLLYLCM